MVSISTFLWFLTRLITLFLPVKIPIRPTVNFWIYILSKFLCRLCTQVLCNILGEGIRYKMLLNLFPQLFKHYKVWKNSDKAPTKSFPNPFLFRKEKESITGKRCYFFMTSCCTKSSPMVVKVECWQTTLARRNCDI